MSTSTDGAAPEQPLSREELIRELERELEKPILPPSDWKERALGKLEYARKVLRESPMGRGSLSVAAAASLGSPAVAHHGAVTLRSVLAPRPLGLTR